MFSSPFQPTSDRGFTMFRTAHEYGDVTTFSQEHQGQDDVAFVGLEPIQGRVQATGETLVTPLTFPILDVFVDTAFSIANERVNALIGNPKIFALGIRTGVTFGGDAFLAATSAFALGVGDNIGVELQNGQRDAGLTAWAVTWRSGFPFSGTVVFEHLAELPGLGFERVPMREQQGDGKQQDQDLFGANGEMVHGMMGISGTKMEMVFRF